MHSRMTKQALTRELLDIARRAGDAIMDIYQDEASFGIERKADDSPLTRADRAANRIICDALAQLPVGFPIISEENKQLDFSERRHFGSFWLVDPLDGTKEFIKRNGEFTVNIALIESGKPVLRAVFAPALEEMYWGDTDRGAFRQVNGQAVAMRAASFALTDPELRVVCSRSHLNTATQAFMEQLDHPQTAPRGSSLKFMLLAKGEAHLYPRLGPTMEWDTGAAQCILEAAGGKVIDQQTRRPLRYNKESLLNPHFIAYGHLQEA